MPVLHLKGTALCGLLSVVLLVRPATAELKLEAAGASGDLLQNLRTRLALAAEPCDAPRWRVRRLFGATEQDLDPALRAFGYYRARVTKSLDFSSECWQARVTVDLGQRVAIRDRSIEISGEARDDPALAGLLAGLPLSPGAPLSHADYESIKDALRQFAAERGYLDFLFERQELRVYPDLGVADIRLAASSGSRYRLGQIHVSEQALDDDFVLRLAHVEQGAPYDVRTITDLDRRLTDSGYFSRVEVRPRRDQAEGRDIPIDIQLESAKRHAWRAGLGYSTDTGPRASLRYDNRYVTAHGHRFEGAMSLSPVQSGLAADYVIPGRDPRTESFSFGARLEHEDTESTLSDSATLTARHTVRRGDWNQNRFVEWLFERSEVGGDETTARLLMPGIALDTVDADDILRTRRGYRISLEARAAHEALLSTTSLLQFKASSKGVYRFGDAGRVTVRGDAGVTLGTAIGDLPASLRFFAGGDNSVRGYAYKSLGPHDDDGEPRGGKHLLTGSVEYEHPVVDEDWWLAGFVDAGNAFDNDEFEVRYGYGLGVRWYSPVGRVRLDLAFPDDTEDADWRIHFGLGVDL